MTLAMPLVSESRDQVVLPHSLRQGGSQVLTYSFSMGAGPAPASDLPLHFLSPLPRMFFYHTDSPSLSSRLHSNIGSSERLP